MDWFLYDNGLRHERVKLFYLVLTHFIPLVSLWSRGFLMFSEGIQRDHWYAMD